MKRTLQRMETATREEIVAHQERRLRHLVRLAAARSPFYREWFAKTAIEPTSIRTLEDLRKMPFLDRGTLARRHAEFCTYPPSLMWAAHSSGTSGDVVTVYRTPGSSVFESVALGRQWSWFGVPERPRRLTLRSGGPDPRRTGSLAHVIPGSGQLVVSSFQLGVVDLDLLLAEMHAFQITAIEGWPSSICLLASRLLEEGKRFPIQAVITSSEVMTRQQVDLISVVLGGRIIDHYGQTERVTLAGQCEAGGYHLFPSYAITELIPVEGRKDRWEIVGTPLNNWGFPLFRYRTGDEVGPALDRPCGCGRTLPMVGSIDGRVEDSFVAADGRPLPVPSVVLDDLAGVREAQVVQLEPGRFEFRLATTGSSDMTAIELQARGNVDRYFGPGQHVTFRFFDRIPRSASGKLKPAIVV